MMALCAVSVFAIDLSLGGNVDYNCEIIHSPFKAKLGILELKGNVNTSTHLLGGNIFFDAQYLRTSIGASFSLNGSNSRVTLGSGGSTIENTINNALKSETNGLSYGNLNIRLVGKYPFKVKKARLYPMAGFDFDINLYRKINDTDVKDSLPEEQKKALNHYYFVFGGGADIFVAKKVFVTFTAMAGIDMQQNNSPIDEAIKAVTSTYNHYNLKAEATVGVGYKF